MYAATIEDGVNLEHVSCPIIFLSPSNDFHGHINDLPKAVDEISSPEWRVVCSPHGSHQDTAEYQIAGLLWFDHHLRDTFTFPQPPQTSLELRTASAIPSFTVEPDAARPILSVDIYYTQHGQAEGGKDDRDNTKSRFWRHAPAQQDGPCWTADLPLINTGRPLWVYANVLYALDGPETAAGYYYSVDLGKDPHELVNLAGRREYAAKVAEMTTLLKKEMERHADDCPLVVEKPKPAEWSPPSRDPRNRTKNKAGH